MYSHTMPICYPIHFSAWMISRLPSLDLSKTLTPCLANTTSQWTQTLCQYSMAKMVPVELQWEIEAKFEKVATMFIIIHKLTPTAWISPPTYTRKAKRSIHVCLVQRTSINLSYMSTTKLQQWKKWHIDPQAPWFSQKTKHCP